MVSTTGKWNFDVLNFNLNGSMWMVTIIFDCMSLEYYYVAGLGLRQSLYIELNLNSDIL
jgi:hypothetical protein